MRSNQRWSTHSTVTSWHHIHPTVTQSCQNLTQFQLRSNSVKVHLWARGVPQLFATTAVHLAELVLSVRYELIASRSLCQFLCKIYAFWPFWVFPSCTCYVFYVGIKENLLGLVLRFQKICTKKYVFYFEKYVFFA